MTKQEIIDYMYENHVQGDFKIEEMAEDLAQPQWIPVSEKLPKTEVLCCDKYGEMIIAYVYEDNKSDTGVSAESETQYMYNCVAWLPLPEPYKEEEE